ncbi:glycosyltransferase family 4 protein [Thermodesulfobacteriota bacterium]
MCKRILLTVPYLRDQGGVASFYNGVLPHFPKKGVILLEIGSTRNFGGLLHPFIDQVRFRHMVKKEQPALIHLNPSLGLKSFIRDGLFAWQAKQLGYPLLVFWHGWDKNFEVEVEKKFMWFFCQTFGRADCFIVLSSEFECKLRAWGITVPVFLETTNVDDSLLKGFDVQKKWAAPAGLSQIKILFLARLERSKGGEETVRAVKFLVDKKIPISLTIAGDGKIRQELEEYTRSLSLTEQQVQFTGDIRGKDKIRILTEHHIYCLPSYSEGLPTTVLEAMTFGMPVVTRPVGGLVDLFKDGQMGALVKGKSPEEIAACLEKIISDQGKMVEIGKYNAYYAKKHFMASVVSKRLVNIYESIQGIC